MYLETVTIRNIILLGAQKVWRVLRRLSTQLYKKMRSVAGKITEIFSDDAIYKEACKALGVRDSVKLAILLNEVRLDLPLDCIKDYLGLTNNKDNGRYGREMRRRLL